MMKIFEKYKINKDPELRALKSIGGNLGHTLMSRTVEVIQDEYAFMHEHVNGVLSGTIIEVDFITKQRATNVVYDEPANTEAFRHVSVIEPASIKNQEIS